MAVVVVLAMAIAIVVSSGQLLVIQAGVQSVFIVALVASQSAAFSRWLDAVVGGLVALVIGVGRARRHRCAGHGPRPPAPCARIASTLRDVVAALRRSDRVLASAALDGARSIEGQLGELRTAAAEGVAVVRQSPLLRGHGPAAEAASALVVPLDHCVRNLRVLARRASVAVAPRRGGARATTSTSSRRWPTPPRTSPGCSTSTRPPSAARGVLERVAGLSARVDPTAGL